MIPSPHNRKIFLNSFGGITSESFEGKDFLTEVSLRAAFKPYLLDLLQQAARTNRNFSIVFLDLDRFKKFNDKYGHQLGDEILKYIGSSLRLTLHDIPCRIFRYGGDEFVIVFPDKTPREAQRLVQVLKYNMSRRPVLFKGRFFKVTASYGISGYPGDGVGVETLVKKADMAQYTSKSQGRNLVTLASEIKSRRIYRAVMLLSIVMLYGLLALTARPLLKDVVESAVEFFVPRMMTEDNRQDILVLKNGFVLRGEITHETYQSLTFNRKIKDRTFSLYINKSEVQDKIYGSGTGSKERFGNYIQANPNPHK